jgi:enoyl-[acyl-carrier protein] reductase II
MIDLPVMAAGGIVDRRGYRAVMALGAQGVQIGTAFLASEESPAAKEWKEAIIGCGDAGTALMPRGRMTFRTIINAKMAELMASGADMTKEYSEGSAGGTFGAGQGSALIEKIKPVKDIIEEMVS